jgi:hypothetical protein
LGALEIVGLVYVSLFRSFFTLIGFIVLQHFTLMLFRYIELNRVTRRRRPGLTPLHFAVKKGYTLAWGTKGAALIKALGYDRIRFVECIMSTLIKMKEEKIVTLLGIDNEALTTIVSEVVHNEAIMSLVYARLLCEECDAYRGTSSECTSCMLARYRSKQCQVANRMTYKEMCEQRCFR